MFEDKETKEKIEEIYERIESKNNSNTNLKQAMNNILFQRAAAKIELLPYGLRYNDEKRNGNSIMSKMIRYDIQTKSRKKAVAWLRFPTSDDKYSAVVCQLQKFRYSSDKVKQPSSTDIYGMPRFDIVKAQDIETLINCIKEYLTKVHRLEV